FEAFVRPLLAGPAPRGTSPAARPFVPIAAYKCLTRMALTIMPAGELEFFPDAIEWILNPDHGFDSRVLGGLGCYVHVAPASFPSPWTALARRIANDAKVPYMLYFLGISKVSLEISVPLCTRDEDLDGEGLIVPRVAAPAGIDPEPAGGTSLFIPMSSA